MIPFIQKKPHGNQQKKPEYFDIFCALFSVGLKTRFKNTHAKLETMRQMSSNRKKSVPAEENEQNEGKIIKNLLLFTYFFHLFLLSLLSFFYDFQ